MSEEIFACVHYLAVNGVTQFHIASLKPQTPTATCSRNFVESLLFQMISQKNCSIRQNNIFRRRKQFFLVISLVLKKFWVRVKNKREKTASTHFLHVTTKALCPNQAVRSATKRRLLHWKYVSMISGLEVAASMRSSNVEWQIRLMRCLKAPSSLSV